VARHPADAGVDIPLRLLLRAGGGAVHAGRPASGRAGPAAAEHRDRGGAAGVRLAGLARARRAGAAQRTRTWPARLDRLHRRPAGPGGGGLERCRHPASSRMLLKYLPD